MQDLSTDLHVGDSFLVRVPPDLQTLAADYRRASGCLGAPTASGWDPVKRATMAEEMNPPGVEPDPGVGERVAALNGGGRAVNCVGLSEVDSLVQETNPSDE